MSAGPHSCEDHGGTGRPWDQASVRGLGDTARWRCVYMHLCWRAECLCGGGHVLCVGAHGCVLVGPHTCVHAPLWKSNGGQRTGRGCRRTGAFLPKAPSIPPASHPGSTPAALLSRQQPPIRGRCLVLRGTLVSDGLGGEASPQGRYFWALGPLCVRSLPGQREGAPGQGSGYGQAA